MRYSKEHKEQIRQKLLTDGGGYAKKHGFADSGVDALAAAAGVTIGSLYKHFNDKSEYFAALVATELDRTAQMFSQIDPDSIDAALKSLGAYLSLHHVLHPETGCPLPTLTPEVARADDSVRAVFEAGVLKSKAIVERSTKSSNKAWTILAQNVGAVMLARAMLEETVKLELLEAVKTEGNAMLLKQGK